MALLRAQFNEGSLLRRTLVHIGTFVFGSIAFVSLMSFLLVSIAKGLVPHSSAATEAGASSQDDDGDAKGGKTSGSKASRNKKLPSAAVESPSKAD
jgi:hypothetical protein